MMKKLIVLIFTSLLFTVPVYARDEGNEEDGGSSIQIPLVYELEGVPSIKVTLDVSGNGCVKDGDEIIRDGIVTYDLRTDMEKVFEIQPDIGYQVSILNINGVDQKEEYEQNIVIKDIEEEQVIEVRFEKTPIIDDKPEDPSDDPIINGNGSITPVKPKLPLSPSTWNTSSIQTGVNDGRSGFTILMMISLCIISIIEKEKRKNS